LIVAESAARAAALKALAQLLARHGVATAWLERTQLHECEPLLSEDLLGGLYLKDDAQVDNRALAEALRAALTNAGGRLREHRDVRSLVVRDDRVRAVLTASGPLEGDIVVLACGAWMNLIGGVGADDLPPVKPAKGQMLACQPPAGTSLPQTPIWSDDIYLVPRKDRLFVGATVEDARFDISISREARDFLLSAAMRLIPSLREWRVAEMWAGLRPRTPDDAPVLGPTAISGLHVASGQFRNGILFAPQVADIVCGLILNERQQAAMGAFDPRRFARL
jgi:glycine oxidase